MSVKKITNIRYVLEHRRAVLIMLLMMIFIRMTASYEDEDFFIMMTASYMDYDFS